MTGLAKSAAWQRSEYRTRELMLCQQYLLLHKSGLSASYQFVYEAAKGQYSINPSKSRYRLFCSQSDSPPSVSFPGQPERKNCHVAVAPAAPNSIAQNKFPFTNSKVAHPKHKSETATRRHNGRKKGTRSSNMFIRASLQGYGARDVGPLPR